MSVDHDLLTHTSFASTDINANMDGAVYVDRTNRMIVLAFMGSKSATSYLLE